MENKERTLTDYLSILYKWKKFLIINLLIVLVLSTVISFLIPETFKSTATVVLTPQSGGALSGLGNMISGNSALSLGSQLLGMNVSNDADLIEGLFQSRTVLEKVIEKFNLYEYYDIDDRNYDKLIKKFSGDIIIEPNEYGMIEVSVINEKPQVSAKMANYFVGLVDSLNISLAGMNAKNNRLFIEKRYERNVSDLKSAEDSMYNFQKKYGIFAVPEQLEISIKAAAEIEAQLVQKEIMLKVYEETIGKNNPQYLNLKKEVNILEKRVKELKYSNQLSSASNVLFPFSKIPKMMIKYLRLFRQVEIQSKIMEYTLPLYEQALLDEQKSIPTLQVIDKAKPAQLKYRPKKAFIILGAFFISFFLFILIVFRNAGLLNKKQLNIIQAKEKNFYSALMTIYKI